MAKILIVDNDAELREHYKRELEREGHLVLAGATGLDGFRLFLEGRPNLVILEICLPEMDGLDLMSRILDRDRRMPVILNTAYAHYRDNFLSWAADAYLIKSTDTQELRDTVRELVQPRPPTGAPITALATRTAMALALYGR